MNTIKRNGRTLIPVGTVWCKRTQALLMEYRCEGEILSSKVNVGEWNRWEQEASSVVADLEADVDQSQGAD